MNVRRLPSSLWLLAAASAVACVLHAQASARAAGAPTIDRAASDKLQAVLDESRRKTGTPGVSAAVMVDGHVVWQGQSGYADSGRRQPIVAGTLYSLASVTKMFVSTMVLRLYERGDLRLDDPIEAYVPSYIPSTDRVTIRELLGHTSGYDDVEGYPDIIRMLNDPNFHWRRDIVLRRVKPVHFKPGSKFEYSNTNYVMLGAVLEHAGGTTVDVLFDRLIAKPLALEGDADFARLARFAPRIAHGYDVENNKLLDTFSGARDLGVPTGDWGPVWTDGGIVASAAGVARFTDALYGGRILRAATLAQMLRAGPDGSYGLGTLRLRFDGHTWQGHDGFYSGFTTETFYDFSRRMTVTVLTNRTDNNDPAAAIWNHLVIAVDALR
ncbi:MAG TPA: serine hydrolase domain-containing protein [Candidatus Eremiobacteraceae bacterium]|nr:serine hydrolase domain-containing protein [Candidatus Eremiobacteraceae bacterium]